MAGAIRLAAICAAAMLTVACVPVGSDGPLFGPQDASRAQLRPGLWALPDKDCAFDPAAAVEALPKCASPTLVRPGVMTGGFGKSDEPPQTAGYLLARGRPLILQLQAPADRKPEEPAYMYAALAPERFDDAGRIVEAHAWLVVCFNPPTDLKGSEPKLFEGLTMKKGDSFCRAKAPDAVRNAARRSKVSIKEETLWLPARWLRDVTP